MGILRSTDLTLLSGRYRRIYGGGWNSPVNGDTHIVIGGTVNSEYSVEDSSQNYYDSRVFGGGVQRFRSSRRNLYNN